MVEGENVEVIATGSFPAEEPASAPGSGTSPLAYAVPANRLVIKDAEMELLVADTDTTVANVTQFASDSGGYIISSRTWFQDGYKFASLRLAVPSTTFETALNTLRIFGEEVLAETASGQDVTAEYVDLDSRLTNLEATAARVREFLDAATTVEESLEVSAELAELEQEIEQIKGQMRYFEGRAAFSTVTVLLTPQRPTPTPTATPTATPTPTPLPVWSAGETFGEASETFVVLSQNVIDLLFWTAVVPGPFLLVLFLVLWGLRRRTGRPDASESPMGD
jgi:hypothetical protein